MAPPKPAILDLHERRSLTGVFWVWRGRFKERRSSARFHIENGCAQTIMQNRLRENAASYILKAGFRRPKHANLRRNFDDFPHFARLAR